MTTRKKLLIGVTTLALTAGWSAASSADENFTSDNNLNATAGDNSSEETDIQNRNQNGGTSFQDASGVISETQNNGANSSINNGNDVAAVISTGQDTGNVTFEATIVQRATQVGDAMTTESGVDDDNIAEDQSFQGAEGVMSKAQNNGANSAINNGNSVAAAIVEGATGSVDLTATSNQTASVTGGAGGNSYTATDMSTNDNDARDDAFSDAQGIMSVVQNNGPNSALNNGNAVAGVIAPGGTVSSGGSGTFNPTSDQRATVGGLNSSIEDTNTDRNQVRNNAFENAQGVGSALQNNGANAALNNGNTVAAVITEGGAGNNTNFSATTTTSNQRATVTATLDAGNSANEIGSDDSNSIANNAFSGTQGVFSVMQNTGANAAANGGNTVAGVIAGGSINKARNFTTESDQTARVNADEGSNVSIESDSLDSNAISGGFADTQGVASATQNNGANATLNNGNTVSAGISGSHDLDSNQNMTTTSTQSSRVDASGDGINENVETNGSHDSNDLTGNAFSGAQGVASVLQNNGANAAANNGNTVSAVIANSAAGAGTDTHRTDSSQTARVDANELAGNINNENASNDTNTLDGSVFMGSAGIASALQNNGANAALNNGNTVSAFMVTAPGGGGSAGGASTLTAPNVEMTVGQSARVEASSSSSGNPDGNQNLEGGSASDSSTLAGSAFQNAEGVFSALQNNGANSAINNGNTVAATIADKRTFPGGSSSTFSTTSNQTAVVSNDDTVGVNGGLNLSRESRDGSSGSPDTNSIGGSAFSGAKGVFSASQNNGANTAANNGNTVAAIIGDREANTTPQDTLEATATQTATVQSVSGSNPADGNISEEANAPDSNALSSTAFSNAQGIGSVLQNNGANSALNNGNTVSAVITDANIASRADLSADSRQTASVSAGGGTLNRDQQGNVSGFGGALPSDESNDIAGGFSGATGVFSVLQNNGPNSAGNNGNTVAAFIAGTDVGLDNPSTLDANQAASFNSRQQATVSAGNSGSSNQSRQQGSNDSNTLDGSAFSSATGVISALQNNGGNSALNNGNTVAAVIAANVTGGQAATFITGQDQRATVNAGAGTNSSEAGGFTATSPIDSDATNSLGGTAFSGAEGVLSVLQNNGANTAANNGNAVTAFSVESTLAADAPNFTTSSNQRARVEATGGGTNTSVENDDSDDTNTVSGAFAGAKGIASLLQNNGPNSALNNGNTVAAILNDCDSCTGTATFVSTTTQDATVVGGTVTAVSMAGSDNFNTLAGSSFAGFTGVASVTQNNGANSAINNGNTVSAIID